MTGIQYQIIRMAKAIEYLDQFISATGEWDEKAIKASNDQAILEQGIRELCNYLGPDYNNEKVNKALEIASSTES